MTHTLENELLRIKIEDHGAELCEIYDKENSRQVLWQADPAYWKRHAPVLFPNVGRYYKDRCQINGKTYCCGQHGFARDMDFVCTEESNVSVTHCLTSSDATREFYPFTFELYITHQLHGKDVSVSWKVINKDTETMFLQSEAIRLFVFLSFRIPAAASIFSPSAGRKNSLTAFWISLPVRLFRIRPALCLWKTAPAGSILTCSTETRLFLTIIRSQRPGSRFLTAHRMWSLSARASRASVSGPLPWTLPLSVWSHGWGAATIQALKMNLVKSRISINWTAMEYLKRLM